jgi:deoxyhypusine synthase
MNKSRFLQGKRIAPTPITRETSIVQLIENNFQAYNAARLREGAQLFAERMLGDDVTVCLTLTGALTPAGLGISAIIPLIEAGFVDWIITTGANLYHDTHFGLGLSMHRGSHQISDVTLREEGVVRIYDIFFDYEVLLSTDAFFREVIRAEEFQREMSTAEFHYLCGKYVAERERMMGLQDQSLLAAAYHHGVPVYTSSPGDSSIGMNVAAMELQGGKLRINPSADVNETAAIVLAAKRGGGKSAVFICGGGSPKNFALQTEPQIQEVLGIEEKGHDYFLQLTDARPDTGGLCVAEGTLIDMPRDLSRYPDGIPIESLAGKSGFNLYSYDHEQKKITLSEVEKAWRTGEQEVWRLRYGWYTGMRKEKYREAELLATPDHLIMLSNGAYKPLKALRRGESLKAFNTSYSVHGYRQIGPGVGKTLSEHRYLLEFKLGRQLEPHEVAHHLDGNHLNNNFDNLIAEHYRLHLSEHRKKAWQAKTEEEKRQFAERHRQSMKEGKAQRLSRKFWDNLTPEEFEEYKNKMYGITREEIKERYANNHKVVSIEPTGIIVPVYDMTVKHTRNFVANGIVVHNSGATPGEAVSWGKIDPDQLPGAVVCYLDSTVALPLIAAYAFAKRAPRKLKRLYDRREEMMDLLRTEYANSTRK